MMDWHECCQKRIIKEVDTDKEMIKSLIKSSLNKLNSQQKLELEETTASSKISLAYDSLRELLEALALSKGYKIYNHECYTALLKEELRLSNLGEDFDEIRKIRNAVNYYGQDINIAEAQIIIENIIVLRKQVERLL